MTRVIRGVGWILLAAGAVVLLYVVYLLWFTSFETAQEQRELKRQFESQLPDAAAPIDIGDAYAVLWFERDGEPILGSEPLYAVEGTALDDLRRGPGHYSDSAAPGEAGNTAFAGHRTTYGAPFADLNDLREGDTIHVLDRDGVTWVYAYAEQRVVNPFDVWVVEEPDPLDLGAPTITLTTCHPRFSAAQRLIAWGQLIGDPKEPTGLTAGDDEQDAVAFADPGSAP